MRHLLSALLLLGLCACPRSSEEPPTRSAPPAAAPMPSSDAGPMGAAPSAAAPSTDAGPIHVTCSAATLSPEPPPATPPLPPAVAETRRRIVAAAVACDYAALGALARTGTEIFTFRFAVDEDPAAYWRELEEKKRAPALATLVRVLSLPHAQEHGVYIWPSAHREKPTPADWQALEGLYSAEEIQMFREEQGPGCVLALRAGVGILASGEWLYGTSGH